MKKKRRKIFSIINLSLIVLFSLLLTSCDLFGFSSTDLIGTWSADILGKVYYTFDGYGKFTSQTNLDDGEAQRHTGKYTVSDSRLTLDFDEESLETDIFIIDDVDKNFLTLKTTGIEMTVTFVKESKEPTKYGYYFKNNSDYKVTITMDIGHEFSLLTKTSITVYTWKECKTFTYSNYNNVIYNTTTGIFTNK